jgi:hypothetical protein
MELDSWHCASWWSIHGLSLRSWGRPQSPSMDRCPRRSIVVYSCRPYVVSAKMERRPRKNGLGLPPSHCSGELWRYLRRSWPPQWSRCTCCPAAGTSTTVWDLLLSYLPIAWTGSSLCQIRAPLSLGLAWALKLSHSVFVRQTSYSTS